MSGEVARHGRVDPYADTSGWPSVPDQPIPTPSVPAHARPVDPVAIVEHEYQSAYVPSAGTPGVFDRRHEADGVYVVTPPSHPRPDTEIPAESPPVPPEPPQPWRRRGGGGGGGAIAASLAVTALVAAGVVVAQVLSPSGPDETGAATTTPTSPAPTAPTTITPTAPTTINPTAPTTINPTALATLTPTTPTALAAAPPPTDVTLRDDGGSITITWRDPTAGAVPFLVAGARLGTVSRPLQTVRAGRTTSIIYGLSREHEYCFTVAAVYSTDMIASSIRRCTHRLSTGNSR